MKTISLIADYQDTPCGKQTIWEIDGKIYNNPAYLHGKLESAAGFDIVFNLSGETENIKLTEPEQEVEIHIHKGEYRIALGILVWWIAGTRFRGLIVAADDEIALEYARRQQKGKAMML